MKYKCSHCNHSFSLAERDFKRCPNCFWTTSLVALEADSADVPAKEPEIHIPPKPKPNRTTINLKPFLIPVLIIIGIAGLVTIFVTQKDKISNFSVQLPVSLPKLPSAPAKKTEPEKSVPLVNLLSQDEKLKLLAPFELTIPRKLSEDEEEILKKQVSLPKTLSDKPKLSAWSKDDFEKAIETEQKKRKVYFGWAYQRQVVKTFENNYPKAVEAYENGDSFLARDLFLKSLSFPVYKNDVKRHRAVALVMLRPFINDVIGKVAVLNKHLMGQQILAEADSIIKGYEAIFPVLDLQEWDKALSQIAELRKQIEAFETKPRQTDLNYGQSFALLDQEIQAAIQAEATPLPEGIVSFKSVVVDLGLKEETARQNTQDALLKVKKESEEILGLPQNGNFSEGKQRLQAIQFPPELAEQARFKISLIERAEAVEKAKQEKKS